MLNLKDCALIAAMGSGHKLKESELAERLGISRQFLQQIYNGEKHFTIKAFNKLEQMFPEYFNDEITVPDKLTAEELTSLRRLLPLNQSQMADKLDISQALLAGYESGERSVSKFTVQKLKDILKGSSEKNTYCPPVHIPSAVVIPDKYTFLKVDGIIIKRHNLDIKKNHIVFISEYAEKQ